MAGGFDGIRDLASAEVYDPRCGGETAVPSALKGETKGVFPMKRGENRYSNLTKLL